MVNSTVQLECKCCRLGKSFMLRLHSILALVSDCCLCQLCPQATIVRVTCTAEKVHGPQQKNRAAQGLTRAPMVAARAPQPNNPHWCLVGPLRVNAGPAGLRKAVGH